MCVNERDDSKMVLLQGVEVSKVKEFRYLGSTVQCNGGCGSEEEGASWLKLLEESVRSDM